MVQLPPMHSPSQVLKSHPLATGCQQCAPNIAARNTYTITVSQVQKVVHCWETHCCEATCSLPMCFESLAGVIQIKAINSWMEGSKLCVRAVEWCGWLFTSRLTCFVQCASDAVASSTLK